MSLQLISINIESNKHLALVTKFLTQNPADVICLMEVFDTDVEILAGDVYPHTYFMPNCKDFGGVRKWGVAILSRYPLTDTQFHTCGESLSDLPVQGMGTHIPLILFASVQKEGGVYRVGAAHFTWTPDGSPNDRQRNHMKSLLPFLASQQDFVLTGDFNIPRGNEMYQELARRYTDNIPSEVTTTIDPHLHRVNTDNPGKLAFVVDYVWTTLTYHATNVAVVQGVSDHCAVKSDIIVS